MARIKVAFFAEILIEDFDGASRTMFQLLRRIPTDQFEFLFICGVGADTLFGYDCITLPTLTIPFNKRYKMAVPALAKRKTMRQLQVFAPDVVHIATPSWLGSFALDYAAQYSKPVISIYHTHFISYVDYYLRSLPVLIRPIKAQIARFQRDFYNRCDTIYIPSESIASELIAGGLEPSRVTIWKRGIDLTLFSPLKKNLVQMREQTQSGLPIILFASRLVWEKNIETLIKTYELAQQRGTAAIFVVVGDGTAKEDCQRRMPKAVFLGNLDHQTLATIYASADVFLFPSISESYGNVVLEAMASGLPCVIADGGGSRDFVEEGINGFRCAPNNPEAYLDKITLLLNDTDLHNKISLAGQAYSRQFNWEALANRYFDDVATLAQKVDRPKPVVL
jgi:glycosyltransferase involved in cell wall biosynthesis